MATNFPNGLQSYGIPVVPGVPLPALGRTHKVWFANPSGSNGHSGKNPDEAVATITKALSLASSGDLIICAPGAYDETVTISRSYSNLTIVGSGGRGAAYIEPSTEDAGGMVVHGDDVTLVNLGVAAEDETAGNYALHVTGSRFRAYGCKFEGGEQQVRLGPGTVAQEAAGTHGTAGDSLFRDCEFAWGTDGLVVVGTDYGAATQIRLEGAHFHNITGKCITEVVGSGGSASVVFRNFAIKDCTFDDAEGGTAPTNYIDLNGDNGNDGIVTRCSFPAAINSGLNVVSTALHWVCNYHTGGVSTGQPS